MSLSAIITNISRCSLHDGKGIRTVVYLKGCALKCKWCHNPEALSAKTEILFFPTKCIHCGRCINICPECHTISDNNIVFDKKKCIACGKCADKCPTGALSLCGIKMTTDDVYNEISKDIHFYKESGGGITLSGGECLLKPEFCAELLKKCKENNIGTAIETALFVPWENVESVIPYVDIIFADLKIPDSETHKEYTGADNKFIIKNIIKLCKKHINVTIRIPIVPGVNDHCISAFSDIINQLADGITSIELLKYNNLAESKYDAAGIKYTPFADESQSHAQMEEYCGNLKKLLNKNIPIYF